MSKANDMPEELKRGSAYRLLTVGKFEYPFKLLDADIVFEALDGGDLTDISVKCSGLDRIAHERRWEEMVLAVALKSVNGYTFPVDNREARKLEWVRQLNDYVRGIMIENFIEMRERQKREVDEALAEIKKLSPNQSLADSGGSSVSSPDI
jgi:hypothetical protein